MRQLIRMLAVASLALCIPTPAEGQVGPLTNNVRLDVSKNLQTNQYFSNGPRGGDAYVFVGRQNGTTSYRAFFQWDLPDDLLPDGSTVSQVQLEVYVSVAISRTQIFAAGTLSGGTAVVLQGTRDG